MSKKSIRDSTVRTYKAVSECVLAYLLLGQVYKQCTLNYLVVNLNISILIYFPSVPACDHGRKVAAVWLFPVWLIHVHQQESQSVYFFRSQWVCSLGFGGASGLRWWVEDRIE